MSAILFLSCVTAFIMLIWFKTDAIIEWAGLIGFKNMVRNFKDARLECAPRLLTYPQYIKEKYNCFSTRLVSCPICLTTWLVAWQCFGLAILLSNIHFAAIAPIVYFLSLFIYGLTAKLFNMTP